jgi:hypothetical protein
MTQSNDPIGEFFDDTFDLIEQTFNIILNKIDEFIERGGDVIDILLSDEKKESASNITIKGCILRRELSSFLGLVHHAGIYIGNGNVIHFSGMGKNENAKIETISLTEFANSKPVYVWATPVDNKHGEQICNKAKEILNNHNQYNGQYDIITNNCEDFVKECYEIDGNELPEFTQRDGALSAIATVVIITGIRLLIFKRI